MCWGCPMSCDLRVGLVLACVPFGGNHEIKFLVQKNEPFRMPEAPAVPGEDGLQTASDLMRKLVGVGARMGDKGWVELRLAAATPESVEPWSMCLVYGGMIPEELPVREEGYEWKSWTSLSRPNAADPLHLKSMLLAAQKI